MRTFTGFQKGVNLGGWISQFAEYDEQHFNSFITEEDIALIAGLGFDHVRVPVDYIVLEDDDGKIRPEGFRHLENCRTWCAAHKLNMLIDLHECYGYSFDPLKKNMDRRKFFYDSDLQARFLRLWKEIAERFGRYPGQVAFEPLNEVVLEDVANTWNELASGYVRMMREIAPDSWLVIGGVHYNSVLSVPLLNLPADSKIVYNFHCYEPMVFSHQGAYWVEGMPSDFRIAYPKTISEYRAAAGKLDADLGGAICRENIHEIGPGFFEDIFMPAVEKAEKDDRPLYCGEYGVIDLADGESKLRWLQDIHTVFRKFGIGHALWNYKEKDFGFQDERFSEIRDRFIAIL